MSETAVKYRKPAGKPLIALTGATGFIGRYLLKELPKRGYRVRVLLRRPTTLPDGCPSAVIGDLARPYNMAEALAEVDAVIHTAGIASTMSGVPEDDYRQFNTEATVGFAKAAQRARVKRFMFLSSIRAQSGPTAIRHADRGQRAPSHRRLWPLQTCRRAGPGGDRARLGRAQAGPGLRARGGGQHGKTVEACPLALPAAAGRTEIGAFLARPRQSGRRCRQSSGGGTAAEAAVHRRRPQAADRRRDDRGHAPRPRPAPRACSTCRSLCSRARCVPRVKPRVASLCSALSSPIYPRSHGSIGSRPSTPRRDSPRFSAEKKCVMLHRSANAMTLCTAKHAQRNFRKLNPKVSSACTCGLTFVAIFC